MTTEMIMLQSISPSEPRAASAQSPARSLSHSTAPNRFHHRFAKADKAGARRCLMDRGACSVLIALLRICACSGIGILDYVHLRVLATAKFLSSVKGSVEFSSNTIDSMIFCHERSYCWLPSPRLSQRGRYCDARCHAVCVCVFAALHIACNLLNV